MSDTSNIARQEAEPYHGMSQKFKEFLVTIPEEEENEDIREFLNSEKQKTTLQEATKEYIDNAPPEVREFDKKLIEKDIVARREKGEPIDEALTEEKLVFGMLHVDQFMILKRMCWFFRRARDMVLKDFEKPIMTGNFLKEDGCHLTNEAITRYHFDNIDETKKSIEASMALRDGETLPDWFLSECLDFLLNLRNKKYFFDMIRAEMNKGLRYVTFTMNICGKQFTITRRFNFSMAERVNHYLQDPEWSTQAICYKRYYLDKDRQKVIAQDLGIDDSTVSKYVDRMARKLAYDLGLAYESHYAEVIAPSRFESFERRGGKGEPDLIGKKEGTTYIVSIKCYDSPTHRTVERSALSPEIEYAKQLIAQGEKNVKAILHFHINSSDFSEEREIDLGNPDEKYTFNPK